RLRDPRLPAGAARDRRRSPRPRGRRGRAGREGARHAVRAPAARARPAPPGERPFARCRGEQRRPALGRHVLLQPLLRGLLRTRPRGPDGGAGMSRSARRMLVALQALVLGLPLFLGGRQPAAAACASVVVLVLLGITLRERRRVGAAPAAPGVAALAVFGVLALATTVPLPPAVLQLLEPASARLYAGLLPCLPGDGGWCSCRRDACGDASDPSASARRRPVGGSPCADAARGWPCWSSTSSACGRRSWPRARRSSWAWRTWPVVPAADWPRCSSESWWRAR